MRLARAAEDPKLCVQAIERNEPFPMEHVYLESRVICFTQANHPRLAEAEDAFGRLLANTRPFGADIPTPPGQKRPSPPVVDAPEPPRPVEDATLGLDAGKDAESSSP